MSIPKFSQIYVEQKVLDHLETQRILNLYPQAVVTPVDHYKDVFNQKQKFALQKTFSNKLILAYKRAPFFYSEDLKVESFDQLRSLYYTDMVRNCPYNCRYCILQALHPSPNILYFVNHQDYFDQCEQLIKNEKVLLSLSYLSDLMALESLLGLVEQWYHFSKKHDLIVEIRTKSDHIQPLLQWEAHPRLLLAWSMSPDIVIQKYEPGTSSLLARIQAAYQVAQKGYPVHLALDPIIWIPDWQEHYQNMLEAIFYRLAPEKISSISVGLYRMSHKQHKKLQNMHKNSDLFFAPMQVKNQQVYYPLEQSEKMKQWILNQLFHYVPKEKVKFIDY